METVKLIIIFSVILAALLVLKRPVWQAALAAVLAAVVLYGISPARLLEAAKATITGKSTLEVIGVVYLVSFMQNAMQKRGMLNQAEEALLMLFNNRRFNIISMPIFLGLLPAPNTAEIAGPIVDSAAGDSLTVSEKAYLTSFYRHIPESILPFYPGMILAMGVMNIPAGAYIVRFFPLVVVAVMIPYLLTVRKVPADAGAHSMNKGRELKRFIQAFWPMPVLISVILIFDVSTCLACLGMCIVLSAVYKMSWQEVRQTAASAFRPKMLADLAAILFFKDVINQTDAISAISAQLLTSTLPMDFIFAGLIFALGVLGLGNAVVTTLFPMAFAAVPGAGMPLFILLMAFQYAASQLSMTHICLHITCDVFKINFLQLFKETLPASLLFCLASSAYYLIIR